MIVDAGAHDVIALTEDVVVVVSEEEVVVVVRAAEVGEEILGLHAPIRQEGIFQTGADGIADPPVVAIVDVVYERSGADQEGVEVVDRRAGAEGNTACAVDQKAVEGDTAATADGAEEARVVAVIAGAEEVVVIIVLLPTSAWPSPSIPKTNWLTCMLNPA